MEGEMERLFKAWLAVLACICYCYFIASKIPKGIPRLLSLLPIFYIFTILPLSLTSILPTGITAFFITWLANFKLLLFAFCSGPLSSHPPKPFPLFLSLACLPIKIQENKKLSSHQKPSSDPHAPPPKLKLSMRTKILIYAILLVPHDYYKAKLHPTLLKVVYSLMLYFFLDVVLGICVGLIRAVSGIELEMPSDEPYLATSLQDFWGKRWNRMVSNTLRDTIYRPVNSACGKLTALMASFLVSGLMHELLYYYIMRVSPTMEVTWFFVLHGVCVVIESKVKDLVAGKWRLHWAVSAPMTVGFVISSAIWLFFPPLERTGALEKPIEECKAVVELLKHKLSLLLHSLS